MSLLENIVPDKFQATKEEQMARKSFCDSCHVRKGISCGKLLLGSRVFNKEKGKWITTCGCIISEKIVLKSEKCDLGKW